MGLYVGVCIVCNAVVIVIVITTYCSHYRECQVVIDVFAYLLYPTLTMRQQCYTLAI